MAIISIVEYDEKYQQQAAELVTGIQQQEFGIPITLEQQPDLQNMAAFFRKDNGNCWLAIVDKKVIGTIALLDIGNNYGALRKMFVAAGYRGKPHATGQLLLDTLMTYAAGKYFDTILLGTTEKLVAAQRFYLKNGFQPITKSDLPVSFPVMQVDTHFYQKRLGEK